MKIEVCHKDMLERLYLPAGVRKPWCPHARGGARGGGRSAFLCSDCCTCDPALDKQQLKMDGCLERMTSFEIRRSPFTYSRSVKLVSIRFSQQRYIECAYNGGSSWACAAPLQVLAA